MKKSTIFKSVMQKRSSAGKIHISKAVIDMALELQSYQELPAFRKEYPPSNRGTGNSELDKIWTRGYAVGVGRGILWNLKTLH